MKPLSFHFVYLQSYRSVKLYRTIKGQDPQQIYGVNNLAIKLLDLYEHKHVLYTNNKQGVATTYVV